MQGMLIAIEGISGAGKTMFSRLLKDHILNINPTILCECYGGFEGGNSNSEITEFCRELVSKKRFINFPILAEYHLLLSEIFFDIEQHVKPCLQRGGIVIYDNYLKSILAFESALVLQYHNKNKESLISYMEDTMQNLIITGNIPKENITAYLECDCETATERIVKRDNMPVTDEQKYTQRLINKQYHQYLNFKDAIIICNNQNNSFDNEIEKVMNKIRIINQKEII